MKFTVRIETPEEFDGELAYIVVRNRAGRAWRSKEAQDFGNAAEEAMIIEEMINDGVKLNPAGWVEVAA